MNHDKDRPEMGDQASINAGFAVSKTDAAGNPFQPSTPGRPKATDVRCPQPNAGPILLNGSAGQWTMALT